MDWRLETPDMLYGHVLGLGRRGRPDVLVQRGEDLRVEHLEAPDPIYHAFQLLEKRKCFKKT